MNKLKQLFGKPSAKVFAQRELEEAEPQLLRVRSQAEYYRSMVTFYEANVTRLKAYMKENRE